jgi:hypothetical protein
MPYLLPRAPVGNRELNREGSRRTAILRPLPTPVGRRGIADPFPRRLRRASIFQGSRMTESELDALERVFTFLNAIGASTPGIHPTELGKAEGELYVLLHRYGREVRFVP